MSDFVFKIDHWFGQFFHNIYLWGGKVTNFAMEGISWLAEAGILFLVVGLALALFKRTRKIGGTILLAVALGFVCTNIILKNIIERTRPFGDISSDFYKWWLDAGAIYEGGYSFPSGHTTATTAFAVAIFLTTNKKYSWPILFLPLLMASSRIYLMVHYFSDCIGGLVVGLLAGILACLIIKWIYCSRLKFFVWLREFNIFNPSKKIKMPNNANNSADTKVKEFVYTPQENEITASPKDDDRLIKKEVQSDIHSDKK